MDVIVSFLIMPISLFFGYLLSRKQTIDERRYQMKLYRHQKAIELIMVELRELDGLYSPLLTCIQKTQNLLHINHPTPEDKRTARNMVSEYGQADQRLMNLLNRIKYTKAIPAKTSYELMTAYINVQKGIEIGKAVVDWDTNILDDVYDNLVEFHAHVSETLLARIGYIDDLAPKIDEF